LIIQDDAKESFGENRLNMDEEFPQEWARVEDDGFIGLVGPIYQKIDAGSEQQFRFTAQPKHKNRGGFVHGGMLMTFADRALSMTARMRDPNRTQATVQFDMHFIQPAKIGEVAAIHCLVLKETRTLAFVEGKIYVDEDLVATAKGVWKIIKAGPSSHLRD
jgi:uncharacterized protein (TIGR00369 family)